MVIARRFMESVTKALGSWQAKNKAKVDKAVVIIKQRLAKQLKEAEAKAKAEAKRLEKEAKKAAKAAQKAGGDLADAAGDAAGDAASGVVSMRLVVQVPAAAHVRLVGLDELDAWVYPSRILGYLEPTMLPS